MDFPKLKTSFSQKNLRFLRKFRSIFCHFLRQEATIIAIKLPKSNNHVILSPIFETLTIQAVQLSY